MILATLCYIKQGGCTLMVHRNKKLVIFMKAESVLASRHASFNYLEESKGFTTDGWIFG